MMRVNNHILIHNLPNNGYVIMDESSGSEIELTSKEASTVALFLVARLTS